MKIDSDILKQLNIINYTIEQRFVSRQNAVYLFSAQTEKSTDAKLVYKSYQSDNMENEYYMLSKLKGHNLPAVMAKSSSSLCLEYIHGKTLLGCLEEAEENGHPFEEYIDAFTSFLIEFYTVMPGYIYGDINLRNFILSKDKVYGVDLEESGLGSIAADIGKAAAFILMYRPQGTDYKQQTAGYLMESSSRLFNVSKQDIEKEKELELKAMTHRRTNTGECNELSI